MSRRAEVDEAHPDHSRARLDKRALRVMHTTAVTKRYPCRRDTERADRPEWHEPGTTHPALS